MRENIPLEMQPLSRQTMMNAFDYFKVFHTNVFITSRYLKKKTAKVDILLFRDFN